MILLPCHKLSTTLGLFALAAACYGGLHWIGRSDNDRITAYTKADLPYAEIVSVAPGSSYFYTWGVTASPRMKAIALEGGEDRYGDTYQQSYSVFSQLKADLAEVGLTLRDVVNVRAYIVADPEPDFDGWNRAFSAFFGTATNPHLPARTTLGIARLFHSDYRVEVEFTAVFPEGRGPHARGAWPNERHARLSRVETSDRWKSFGRPAWPMSTGKATAASTGLFFSSSVRPKSLMPNAPPGFHMYGTIAQQSESLFQQMGEQLKIAGMGFEDVFFIRACVYPGSEPIGRSFALFNQAYQKRFNNGSNPNRPTRTVMSTPGFNYRNQSLSIEYYAAYPSDAPLEPGRVTAAVGRSDALSAQQPIASAGVAVSPEARLLFVSGCIASRDGSFEAQARSALEGLRARLERVGASLSDVVQLRAYLPEADAQVMDTWIATWENLYRETFIGEAPPALTTLPVIAVPGGGLIELEATAAVAE